MVGWGKPGVRWSGGGDRSHTPSPPQVTSLRSANAELRQTVLRLSTLDLHVDPLHHHNPLSLLEPDLAAPPHETTSSASRHTGSSHTGRSDSHTGSHTTPRRPPARPDAPPSSHSPSPATGSHSPSTTDVDIVFNESSLGIDFNASAAGFLVQAVSGAAEQHGVRPGDVIIRVNNRSLPADATDEELAELLTELPRPLLLGFRRASSPAPVPLPTTPCAPPSAGGTRQRISSLLSCVPATAAPLPNWQKRPRVRIRCVWSWTMSCCIRRGSEVMNS